MMRMLLPSSATFTCAEDKRGRWRFRYEERFPPTRQSAEALTNMILAAAGNFESLGLRVKRLGRYGVRVSGTGLNRQIVGGFVAAEFMAWSRLGDLCMRDLLGAAAMGMSRANAPSSNGVDGDA